MRRVHDVKKMTDNPYLNMYALDMCDECGKHSTYYLASRNQSIEDLKLSTGVNKADGVIVYAVYKGKNKGKRTG